MKNLEILFEDNHLLFVNKPAGMLTQPSGSTAENLEDLVKRYIQEKYDKKGAVFVHAAHRLDRQVSGIVLFAKTSKALSRLHESLRERKVSKQYLAICEGNCEGAGNGEPVTLEQYLIHGEHMAKIVPQGTPGSKLSILSYQFLAYKNGCSLITIDLKSGRYHQIRAQLAASSHPIVGDHKYGSQRSFSNHAIALHHLQMQLVHPVTKKELTVRSEPPAFWPYTS